MIGIPDYIVDEYAKKLGFIKKGEHLLQFTGYAWTPVTDRDEPQPIQPSGKCVLCGWSGFWHSATAFECKITDSQ